MLSLKWYITKAEDARSINSIRTYCILSFPVLLIKELTATKNSTISKVKMVILLPISMAKYSAAKAIRLSRISSESLKPMSLNDFESNKIYGMAVTIIVRLYATYSWREKLIAVMYVF